MTPKQAWTRVRRIAFELERADYGMGMPRDYSRVLELRVLLEQVVGGVSGEMPDYIYRQAGKTAFGLGGVLAGILSDGFEEEQS